MVGVAVIEHVETNMLSLQSLIIASRSRDSRWHGGGEEDRWRPLPLKASPAAAAAAAGSDAPSTIGQPCWKVRVPKTTPMALSLMSL
jgi:hypothetical protein